MEAKGGTGNTFCLATIISKLRGLGKIVLAMAVSAQAACLFDGGRTAHSKLKIPIDLDDTKRCNFKEKSVTAKLIKEAALLMIGKKFGFIDKQIKNSAYKALHFHLQHSYSQHLP